MKQVFLVLGAAALGFAGPAVAKPGHGKGHGRHGNPHVTGQYFAPGLGACPPGLAKKGCIPPGQAKKLFNVGQRFPRSYGTLWGFNQIPLDLRRHYGFDARDRYYYGDGYIYRVDPRTMLIEQAVIAALLR